MALVRQFFTAVMDLQPQNPIVWQEWHFQGGLARTSTGVQDKYRVSVVFLDRSQGKSQ